MPADISSQVLEDVHYIVLPANLSDGDVSKLESAKEDWAELSVSIHVFDSKNVANVTVRNWEVVADFARVVRLRNARVIALNMSDPVHQTLLASGLENALQRVKNLGEELYQKREINPIESRRLLFKYLAQAVFRAFEVTFNSTASCDENYSISPEKVPLKQFDLIATGSFSNESLKADIRLCCSTPVLERLARAMLGPSASIDRELVEGMASELLNLIYGYAKSHLNDKESFRLPVMLPKLLRAQEIQRIQRGGVAQLQIMPVVTPLGSFYVEVDFH